MNSITKFYLVATILATLSACSSLPKSDFKEVNEVGNLSSNTKEINICRNGSISDNTFVLVYFDNQYITQINNSAYFKSNIKILYDFPVNKVNFIARSARDRQAGSFNLNNLSYKKVNVLIDSNTTNAKIVPLPFIVFFGTSGERKIKTVNDAEFEEACGDTAVTIFSK